MKSFTAMPKRTSWKLVLLIASAAQVSNLCGARAADTELPTKVIPLYLKVECLPASNGKKAESDESGYDFRSSSPAEFVESLQAAVAKSQGKLSAAKENHGNF
jgi:hypothetical protein